MSPTRDNDNPISNTNFIVTIIHQFIFVYQPDVISYTHIFIDYSVINDAVFSDHGIAWNAFITYWRRIKIITNDVAILND